VTKALANLRHLELGRIIVTMIVTTAVIIAATTFSVRATAHVNEAVNAAAEETRQLIHENSLLRQSQHDVLFCILAQADSTQPADVVVDACLRVNHLPKTYQIP
jgi:hypothetical protein